jgi:hypothetical protein
MRLSSHKEERYISRSEFRDNTYRSSYKIPEWAYLRRIKRNFSSYLDFLRKLKSITRMVLASGLPSPSK